MKKLLILCLVLFVISAVSADITTGLRAWWKMDQSEGSTVIDSSGNGFDGIKHSSLQWQDGSLYFPGNNWTTQVNFDSVASDLFSTVDDEVSFSFWVKSAAESGSDTGYLYKSNVLGEGTANSGRILCEYPSFNAGWWHMGRGDKLVNYGGYMDFINDWTHWAITKNTNTGMIKLYKNGELTQESGNKTQSMAGINSFTLGTGNYRWFEGSMKDFRIYDRELSASDVAEIVPEPLTLAFLGLGGLGLINKRKNIKEW